MKEHFGLYLILTDPVAGYEICAKAAVDLGVRYLQLRMKNEPKEEIYSIAERLRDITSGTETRFIVNDELEVAMESDADGIHLGQNDISLEKARRRWNRPDKLFGLSTHNLAQAKSAEKTLPDLIGIGPIFPTQTKQLADPALGPETGGKIAQSVGLTSVAIGGINHENLKQVLSSGFSNYCVVSAVNNSSDPATAIQNLQNIWKMHRF